MWHQFELIEGAHHVLNGRWSQSAVHSAAQHFHIHDTTKNDVLSGFENESTESRETDVVRKTVPGSKDNTRAKTTLVVLITPRLID